MCSEFVLWGLFWKVFVFVVVRFSFWWALLVDCYVLVLDLLVI